MKIQSIDHDGWAYWSDDNPCNIYVRVACLNSFRKDHRYRGGIVFNEGGLQDAGLRIEAPCGSKCWTQRGGGSGD